jgi:hypothetical protein
VLTSSLPYRIRAPHRRRASGRGGMTTEPQAMDGDDAPQGLTTWSSPLVAVHAQSGSAVVVPYQRRRQGIAKMPLNGVPIGAVDTGTPPSACSGPTWSPPFLRPSLVEVEDALGPSLVEVEDEPLLVCHHRRTWIVTAMQEEATIGLHRRVS